MAAEIKTVHDLLRINKSSLHLHEGAVFASKQTAPASLRVAPAVERIEEGQFKPKVKLNDRAVKIAEKGSWGLFAKDYVRYPLIFAVAFGFFYVILNFGAFSGKVYTYFVKEEPKPETAGTVLGVATPDYEVWIKRYFYQVNNPDALSPNFDYEQDGLTNYQEFLLKANPAKRDTDNDNYSDGREILNGYNPLYEGKLTDEQQKVISTWDLRDISNRISYYARLALSSSKPGINPLANVAFGPVAPASLPAVNYDLTVTGEIRIPKLGVRAPVVWSKSPDDFSRDLESGAIHFPGTPYPGQAGVSYISAHSSNYIWSNSKYSYVFSRINELASGDEFFVTVPKTDGEKLTLRYVVFAKNEYKPDDQAQFEGDGGNANESVVNLSTCWPLGSTARRLVVSGKLTGI